MEKDNIIREIRRQLNMTQDQFAKELGVAFSTVNRWENGKTTPAAMAVFLLENYCKQKNVDNKLIERLRKE